MERGLKARHLDFRGPPLPHSTLLPLKAILPHYDASVERVELRDRQKAHIFVSKTSKKRQA